MVQEITGYAETPGDFSRDKTAVTSKTFGESWSLDPTGNWCTFRQDTDGDGAWDLDQARDHNVANEIVDIDNTTTHVAHDRCGNMTRIPKPDDWSAHYDLTYDAWNRLVSVSDGASQDLIAEHEYDGRNYRISKTLPAESPSSSSSSGTTTGTDTRHFYYNHAWQCLEERLEVDASSSSGTPAGPPSTPDRQFTWGQRYIDDLILRDRATTAPPDGQLDERLYALEDPNWNVSAIGDAAGALQERYTFEAYGTPELLAESYRVHDTSAYNWEYLFAGRSLDDESGIYYYRARGDHAGLGRFISRDPVGPWAERRNLYCYVVNRPLDRVDPHGLEDGLAPPDWMSPPEVLPAPPPEVSFPADIIEGPLSPWAAWEDPSDLLVPVPTTFHPPLGHLSCESCGE